MALAAASIHVSREPGARYDAQHDTQIDSYSEDELPLSAADAYAWLLSNQTRASALAPTASKKRHRDAAAAGLAEGESRGKRQQREAGRDTASASFDTHAPDGEVHLSCAEPPQSCPSRYSEHFSSSISNTVDAPRASERMASSMQTGGTWQASNVRKRCRIAACRPHSTPLPAPAALTAYSVKPRVQANFAHAARQDPDSAAFNRASERIVYAMCNTYADVAHCCLPYPAAPHTLAPEEDAGVLHAVQHLVTRMDTVKRNSERLADGSLEAGQASDQGFVRPTVLLLAPTRGVAYGAVLRMLALAQRENRKDSVQGKQRFHEEFGAPEDSNDEGSAAAAGSGGRHAERPAEYKALLRGTNTNDHFRIGIRLTRGSVKLFTDFYQSDIIVASPLGIATRIADDREDGSDFLSSIEVALVLRADFMLMQNWSHVETTFAHLNQMPKQQHDTDIMRVRRAALDQQACRLRQTILFSSFTSPEINALVANWANHSGIIKIEAACKGVLQHVIPQIKQLFRRVPVTAFADSHEQRFQHFATHIWPRIKEAGAAGLLIFAASYFDFVRLRGFLKQQKASFAVNSEYTDSSNVMRARSRFRTGERKILLYTERAHFYFRPHIKGVQSVLFYSLPLHAHYYAELVNFVSEAHASQGQVEALYTEFDFLTLSRVLGEKRAQQVVTEKAASFLFT